MQLRLEAILVIIRIGTASDGDIDLIANNINIIVNCKFPL